MIAQQIYNHLYQFVHSFGPILTSLPTGSQSFRTFSSYLPLKFEANIKITDINQEYYFRITPEDYYIKKRNYDFCDYILSADSKTWIKVFSGKSTLIGEFNLGNLQMTNVRELYVLKFAFLSGILFSFATKKQRLIRTGKYFKFPLFSRKILTPVMKILLKLFKLIPDYVFERLMKRISPLLEED